MQKKLSIGLCMTMIMAMLIVSCSKADSFLTVSTNQLDFAVDGGTKTFTISSSGSWTITSGSDRMTATPSSGSGNATITVRIGANPLWVTANETIVVLGSGTRQQINVKQGGGMAEELTVHVSTAGGLAKVLENYVLFFIEKIKITGSLNRTDFDVFNSMYSLTSLDISGCTLDKNEIPSYVFYRETFGHPLQQVVFPASLRHIREGAFSSCKSLKMPTFPAGLETIGNNAFFDCISFSGALKMPASLTTIGDRAFAYCTGLTSVTFADKLETIDLFAFRACVNLKGELLLPASLKKIGLCAFEDTAFGSCKVLAVNPPVADDYFLPAGTPIFVPFGSVTAYMGAASWKTYPISSFIL